MKYYKDKILGVIGVGHVGHTDGDHTFLPNNYGSHSWILTEDLKDSRKEAEESPPARFYGEE